MKNNAPPVFMWILAASAIIFYFFQYASPERIDLTNYKMAILGLGSMAGFVFHLAWFWNFRPSTLDGEDRRMAQLCRAILIGSAMIAAALAL